MQIINERDVPYRDGDSGVKYLMRGPLIDWGLIRILPGDGLGLHLHEQVEETFYVLAGEGVLVGNGERCPATPGMAYRLEPRDSHNIINTGSAPLDLVFIKCPYAPDDKVNL
jgi:mannose-6-phosphate isomerase-like protein (cupin superfamily)